MNSKKDMNMLFLRRLVASRGFSSSSFVDFRLRTGEQLRFERRADADAQRVPFGGDARRALDGATTDDRRVLTWLASKLALAQDALLVAPPASARPYALIRRLAALLNRELEVVALSRDTSDAQLKQRRELRDGSVVYVDSPVLAAARHGRLLALLHLEKAERNVLPLLNNLLENRELDLDSGERLVPAARAAALADAVAVHPAFAVVATYAPLAQGRALDPPLRSRFQAHWVDHALYAARDAADEPLVRVARALRRLNESSTAASERAPELSDRARRAFDATRRALGGDARRALRQFLPRAAYAHSERLDKAVSVLIDEFFPAAKEEEAAEDEMDVVVNDEILLTPTLRRAVEDMEAAHAAGANILLVAADHRTSLVDAFAARAGVGAARFHYVHEDTHVSELLQRRATSGRGTTSVETGAVAESLAGGGGGALVVLGDAHRVPAGVFTSLLGTAAAGELVLPLDGARVSIDSGGRGGRVVVLWDTSRRIDSELLALFNVVVVPPLPAAEKERILRFALRDDADAADDFASFLVGAADELGLSLRSALRIARRRPRSRRMLDALIRRQLGYTLLGDEARRAIDARLGSSEAADEEDDERLEALIDACATTEAGAGGALVPSVPSYAAIAAHEAALREMARDVASGANLLLLGRQGVGKNVLADRFLSLARREREYVSVHEATTLESLVETTTLARGELRRVPGPLLRAATHGRCLLIDELDKASPQLLASLHPLLATPPRFADGRRAHARFSIIALANPPSYPFHGRSLARLFPYFAVHALSHAPLESELALLRHYDAAGRVDDARLRALAAAFRALRHAFERAELSYPYSMREAIQCVRHAARYGPSTLADALGDMLAVHRQQPAELEAAARILKQHRLAVRVTAAAEEAQTEAGGSQYAIAYHEATKAPPPLDAPKHGKEDDAPHVGGSTFAGGTGGSNTAGLGGRGGPYRLDKGHAVHQLADTRVPPEVEAAARRAGRAALQAELARLKLSAGEHAAYEEMARDVRRLVPATRALLRALLKADADDADDEHERQWLRRLADGELDTARLVDGLAGDEAIFKRKRRQPEKKEEDEEEEDKGGIIDVHLVCDASGSMYYFNGLDRRLERALQAALLLAESVDGVSPRLRFTLTAHSGDEPTIALLPRARRTDQKARFDALRQIALHAQYTWSGDHTLDATQAAVAAAPEHAVVLVLSDANLRRYGISARQLAALVEQAAAAKRVKLRFLFISNANGEAEAIVRAMPRGSAAACTRTSELPQMLRQLLLKSIS